MKPIKINKKELRAKALREKRKAFAPKTRIVKSKKVYHREKYIDSDLYCYAWMM
jgi:hypothetical protein